MHPEPIIIARGISRSYGEGEATTLVFSDLSLDVSPGEMLLVMGPSGVGKSTLLHILAGLDLPDEGRVVVDGIEISSLSEERRIRFRRKRVGLVFQFHHLLEEFNAIENVAIPLLIAGAGRREAMERARAMLDRLMVADKARRFAREMSGGEQQRIALARALVTGAKILLADEPTGNLDRGTERATMELIRNLHGQSGLTSVIVTHNERLIPHADRVLRFEEGVLRSFRV